MEANLQLQRKRKILRTASTWPLFSWAMKEDMHLVMWWMSSLSRVTAHFSIPMRLQQICHASVSAMSALSSSGWQSGCKSWETFLGGLCPTILSHFQKIFSHKWCSSSVVQPLSVASQSTILTLAPIWQSTKKAHSFQSLSVGFVLLGLTDHMRSFEANNKLSTQVLTC